MKKIGPTFSDELIAAGLGGLPFSWSDSAIFGREELTADQRTALDAVIAAHDPSKVSCSFYARDLLAVLTRADATAIRSAIAANSDLWLLWCALQAQGEAPISCSSVRFQAGWAGLATALGGDRAAAIASELKLVL